MMYSKEEAKEIERLVTIPADKLTWAEERILQEFMRRYPEAFENICDK